MKLKSWRKDRRAEFARLVTKIGPLRCSITWVGKRKVGRPLYAGTVDCVFCALESTPEECEEKILEHAARERDRLIEDLKLAS